MLPQTTLKRVLTISALTALFFITVFSGAGWSNPSTEPSATEPSATEPPDTEPSGTEPSTILAEPAISTTAASLDQDLAAFKRLRLRLTHLSTKVKHQTNLFGSKPANDTTLLRPDKRHQIIALWYPIIDCYLALDALSEKHAHFYQAASEKDRLFGFHLNRGVMLTQYRTALEIILVLEQNPVVDTILNESDPSLGLPSGLYGKFKYQYLNVLKAGRYAALEAMAKIYEEPEDPELKQWANEDSRIILAAGRGPGPLMTVKNGLAILTRLGHKAWFPLQKGVAQWMGQTKVLRPNQYLIQREQVENLAQQLEPGDILLERREWYLTNVGIPGYWTHVALYIGTAEQRNALSRHPEVKSWLAKQGGRNLDELIKIRYPKAWQALQTPFQDSHLPEVIEAISAGVTFTSLSYSASCDALAVLRPRLSMADRAAAILRAMRYHGRPYDYDFDFGSDQRLVCTELVIKAYLPGRSKKGLRLPVENLAGRMVTPANTFAKLFDKTFDTPHQQTDLVVFLDGNEKMQNAAESDTAAFRRSWKRPKWHILTAAGKKTSN